MMQRSNRSCPTARQIWQLFQDCRLAGVTLYLDGETLRYQSAGDTLPESLRDAIKRHKAALIALLRPEQELDAAFHSAVERDTIDADRAASQEDQQGEMPLPSPAGQDLLEPFLPVIRAAHKSELPRLPLAWSRFPELNAYVCALAAGIWYGETLSAPELPDRLENLRRLQEWFEGRQTRQKEHEAACDALLAQSAEGVTA